MDIEVPKPEMTDYGRAQFATEVAFTTLVKEANALGLFIRPYPPMGLMYLPDQALTRNFQEACRAILLALTPQDTHVARGYDGKEFWKGESTD
jgi:hypothetical protein